MWHMRWYSHVYVINTFICIFKCDICIHIHTCYVTYAFIFIIRHNHPYSYVTYAFLSTCIMWHTHSYSYVLCIMSHAHSYPYLYVTHAFICTHETYAFIFTCVMWHSHSFHIYYVTYTFISIFICDTRIHIHMCDVCIHIHVCHMPYAFTHSPVIYTSHFAHNTFHAYNHHHIHFQMCYVTHAFISIFMCDICIHIHKCHATHAFIFMMSHMHSYS